MAPDEFRWALIDTGYQFQALVGELLLAEDSDVRAFSRRSKDAGQDARSADVHTVYQMKHHVHPTKTAFRKDVREALRTIATYREPGHEHHDLWRDVDRWVLVTNAPRDVDDDQWWGSDEVQGLRPKGLNFDRWHREDLEARLRAHPHIKRAWFDGEPRAFLNWPEQRERLVRRELLGASEFDCPTLIGRAAEMEAFRAGLRGGVNVLLVTGPGGVGKSRFVLEAAEQAVDAELVHRAIWARNETMTHVDSWTRGLPPDRPILLVLDDPEAELVRLVLEQIDPAVGPVRNWIVVVVTPSVKAHVAGVLEDPSARGLRRHDPIELGPLSKEDATALARELVQRSGLRDEWRLPDRPSDWVARVADRVPMWMSLAVRALRHEPDPTEAARERTAIARRYVNEVITFAEQGGVARRRAGRLLRWIAVFRRVNRHDERAMAFLAGESGLDDAAAVREILTKLVDKRALDAYGERRRTVAVWPDVLRDHVVEDWLTEPDPLDSSASVPSAAARDIAARLCAGLKGRADGRAIAWSTALVDSLADVALGSSRRTGLLDVLMTGLHERIEASKDPRLRRALVERAGTLARVLPDEFVSFCAAARTAWLEPPNVSTLTGYEAHQIRELHQALVRALSRAARHASERGERHRVLRELVALIDVESALPQSGNPLQRHDAATSAFSDVLHHRATMQTSFVREALALAEEQIGAIASDEPLDAAQRHVTHAVLAPQLAVQRTDAWASGGQFSMRPYFLGPESEEARARRTIRERLWEILQHGRGAEPNRLICWELLEPRSPNVEKGDRRDALDRTRGIIEKRVLPLTELLAARRLWEWNLEFDGDGEAGRLADLCEQHFVAHPANTPVVRWLFETRMDEHAQDRFQAALNHLRAAAEGEALTKEVESALAVADALPEKRGGLHGLRNLVARLAFDCPHLGTVKSFVRALLSRAQSPGHAGEAFEVGVAAAEGLVAAARKSGEPDAIRTAYRTLIAACGTDRDRATVLDRALATASSAEELDILDAHLALLVAELPEEAFVRVGALAVDHPERQARMVARLWQLAPAARRSRFFEALVRGIQRGERSDGGAPGRAGNGRLRWLVDQLVHVSVIDDVSDTGWWYVQKLAEGTGRLPLGWFRGFVDKRLAALEAQERRQAEEQGRAPRPDGASAEALPRGARLAPLVDVVPDIGSVEEFERVFEALLDAHTRHERGIGRLPEHLARVDPDGRVLPDRVVARIRAAGTGTTGRSLAFWAEFAAGYPEGGPAWRAIVTALCEQAEQSLPVREREALYSDLTPSMGEGWQAPYGGVDPSWLERLERLARWREEEPEGSPLESYWRWRCESARATFEMWRGKSEEDARDWG